MTARMRSLFRSLAAMAIPRAATPGLAEDAPRQASTLREFWRGLSACLGPTQLSSGLALTVRFALKRDGSLIGEPRVTYAKLPDDEQTRQDDLATIRKALDHCLPVKITDGLGGAIAGRPITIRFVGGKPDGQA